jgi:hypothetical protein
MTFETFVYRAHLWSVKQQARMTPGKAPGAKDALLAGLGALVIQILMGLCYARILQEGERQWRKQNYAKRAVKKSVQVKRSAPSAKPTSTN